MFDAYYFAHGCGRPYQRDELWLGMFAAISDHIVAEIRPSTALDAGCAMGFLVEALRARGVDAHGIDVAEYAIQQVHADIRPYCRIGSVLDPLDRTFDLIACIEVLEHLPRQDAERAVANLCRHSDDILFSSSPSDHQEVTHLNVQPVAYWAELFARHGFYRDVDYDATYITPWAVRFRRAKGDAFSRVVAAYERRHWQLLQEAEARRDLNIELRNELATNADAIRSLAEEVSHLEPLRAENEALHARLVDMQMRWSQLEASLGGRLLHKAQHARAWIAPPQSVRDQVLDNVIQRFVLHRHRHRGPAIRQIETPPVAPPAPVMPRQAPVDIVVCVHNALDDVKRCLDSVVRHTAQPYTLLLVDDGSAAATRDYLAEFARTHSARRLRNESAVGYTRAANQGMRAAAAPFVLLLNSDTIVTPEWLDRLVACAEANPRFGLAGPLSNTASWQSIPDLETNGDWAENPLPPGMTPAEMARLVALYSARLHPTVPFLNGFCYLIRRDVVEQIGYFDEVSFPQGYGEEDDYTLRAAKAGWLAAIADDAYVYHAQSRSYSHERRRQLTEQSGRALVAKHGQALDDGVAICRSSRVLKGIRARSRVLPERAACVDQGRARFGGRRVLFVLPIAGPGGGANVVVDEASAMREMGVDVALFNLLEYRRGFEAHYKDLPFPVVYGEPGQLADLGAGFDAVIATWHASVAWLRPLDSVPHRPQVGYYVQDFEPYMYAANTPEYAAALASYTAVPGLVRFTKTEWTRQEVLRHAGVDSTPIGVSINTGLFQPRPLAEPGWPQRPLRVAAMVRPASTYRSPRLTMELLRQATREFGREVEPVVFGAEHDDPGFQALPLDFPFVSAGVLSQAQVAHLLSGVDIFVDFSTYQAMGLTALEAMACGAAVIVPSRGGATSFARHGENSLVIDTDSRDECWRALRALIQDQELRQRLQDRALRDVCAFYPERAAYNILDTLLGPRQP